jgi:predicted RNA binding protein YcfA (HicA-like mRNA interferase family)
MSKAEKLLQQMKSNPKADWTPNNIKTLCNAFNLTLRQRGTSHAVLTNAIGQHLTIPMHKPVKPLYIKCLIKLIEAAQ